MKNKLMMYWSSGYIFETIRQLPEYLTRTISRTRLFWRLMLSVFIGINGSISVFAAPQNPKDHSYYLIDSMDLSSFTASDSVLLDSGLQLYHSAINDTQKIVGLSLLSELLMDESWFEYNQLMCLQIKRYLNHPENYTESQLLFLKQKLAGGINNFGFQANNKGDIPKALAYYEESLLLSKELNDKEGMATVLNNIGLIFKRQGNIVRALKYYHESLEIQREINDQAGIARSLNNIGQLYASQNEFAKGEQFIRESLEIRLEINDQVGISECYNNLAILFNKNNQSDQALSYHEKSFAISKKLGNKKSMANSLNNIALIHRGLIQNQKARSYYNQAIEILLPIQDKRGLAISYQGLGALALSENNLKEALTYGKQSFDLASELGFPKETKYAADLLRNVYLKKNDYKNAFEMYQSYIRNRDIIDSEDNKKETIRSQTKFELEKEELIKQQEAKEAQTRKENSVLRRNRLQYSAVFIFVLLLFAFVFMSGKFAMSERVAEGLIFFTFILFFEFLLVLSDPYVDQFTNKQPIYKMLINSALAALIFPLHAFFEKRLKERILKH